MTLFRAPGRRRDDGPAPGIDRVFLRIGGQWAPRAHVIALHVAPEREVVLPLASGLAAAADGRAVTAGDGDRAGAEYLAGFLLGLGREPGEFGRLGRSCLWRDL